MARATMPRHAAELRSAIYNTVSFVYVPITANKVLDFPVHKYPRKSVSSSKSEENTHQELILALSWTKPLQIISTRTRYGA